MDNEALHKFQVMLDQRKSKQASKRFKITDYKEPIVKDMLIRCYRSEVAQRRVVFIDDEGTQNNISKASKWLTGDYKVGLILYGGVGNGKTTLARSICELIAILFNASEWTETGVVKVSALELSKMIIDTPDKYKKLKETELLFIDDIGTEPTCVKSWGNECSPLTELIYSRYDNQLFTLATSNLNDVELKERYGLRISDRLNEMFEKVYFPGSSYRK